MHRLLLCILPMHLQRDVEFHRLVILDSKDSWAAALVEQGIVERFIEADLSHSERVWDVCLAAVTQVEQVWPAVCTQWTL